MINYWIEKVNMNKRVKVYIKEKEKLRRKRKKINEINIKKENE